ncbi:MAG: hypothetical protein H6703_00285 [Myxococcales bacterium]|nr:hypothetical protein [Myxococcales bacterium]MCB9540868.1 hypothetical protein [Myxococcales bacterium]MCB9551466.1 hypothetical protein [Myxococcales bacterium]
MSNSPFLSRMWRPLLLAVACAGLVAGTGCDDPIRDASFSTLRLTPEQLIFPRMAAGTSQDRSFMVENLGESPLKLAGVTTDLTDEFNLYYTLSGTGDDRQRVGREGGQDYFPRVITVPPGERLVVVVNYNASNAVAPRGRISMEANDPDNPVVEVPVTVLAGGPELDVTPRVIDFGRVPAGSVGRETVRATNIGTETVFIDGLRLDGSASFHVLLGGQDIADAGDPAALWADPDGDGEPGLAAGHWFEIDVTYSAVTDNFDEGTVVITSNDSVSERTVDLQANGDTPCVRVTPETVEFGPALIERDTRKRVTIESCGGQALVLEDIRLVDDGGGVFSLEAETLPPLPSQLPALDRTQDPPVPPSRGITVVFTPVAEQASAGRLVVATNDPVTPEIEVPLVGRGTRNECPIAAAADTEYDVLPLDIITLDASPSLDPDGPDQRPVRYEWTVIQRPAGSTSVPVEQFNNPLRPADGGRPDSVATPTAQFFVDLAGEYVIELQVVDSLDATAPSDACPQSPVQVRISAQPDEDIHVQLVWDTPGDPDQTDADGTDVDLWFLHPSARFWNDPFLRCFYGNTNPDWGMLGAVDDNPSLDIDDTTGAGPENVNLNNPENTQMLGGAYRVGVHYYRSWEEFGGGGDYGPSLATVRIYLGGALAFEGERELFDTEDFWEVASIVWTPGERRVQPINRFSELPPN